MESFGRGRSNILVLHQVFFCLYIGFSTAGITYGTGRHRADLEIENYQLGMRVSDPTIAALGALDTSC